MPGGGRAHPEFLAFAKQPDNAWSPVGRRIVLAMVLVVGAMLVASAFYFAGGPGLDGSAWLLTEALEYPDGPEAVPAFDAVSYSFTITFKKDTFTGQGPVNSYLGSYRPSGGGRVRFAEVAHTEIGGPADAMQAEDRYFPLFEQVARYEYVGDTLVFFDGSDRVVLRYRRLR